MSITRDRDGDTLTRIDVVTQPSQIGGSWLQREQLATSMSRFPRYATNRASWRGQHERVIVRLHTEDGRTGIGATRGTGAAGIVLDHLSALLRGRQVSDHEQLYEELSGAQITYGVSGLSAAALSAVDLALWDLRAQEVGAPLARLLAEDGPVRASVPCYTTMHPESERDLTGFLGVKLAARYGPHDGSGASAKAAHDLVSVRARLPHDILLMVDAACGWTADFTLDVLDRAGEGTVDWLEDPILPWDHAGYKNIANRLAEGGGTKLCLGNYDFSVHEGERTLAEGLVDVYQPDLTWVGGLTAARRLSDQASAQGAQFSPHYGAMHPWTVHLLGACVDEQLAEFIPTAEQQTRDDFPDLPVPQRGHQPVPTAPGASSRVPDSTFDQSNAQSRSLERVS